MKPETEDRIKIVIHALTETATKQMSFSHCRRLISAHGSNEKKRFSYNQMRYLISVMVNHPEWGSIQVLDYGRGRKYLKLLQS